MGLFAPAWKNMKLIEGPSRDKILKSVEKISNEAELMEVICSSPHECARIYAIRKVSRQGLFELALNHFPDDFFDTLNFANDFTRSTFQGVIMGRFQPVPYGDYKKLAESFSLDEEGMSMIKTLSAKSKSHDIRQAADLRLMQIDKLMENIRKYAAMSDEDVVVDYLTGLKIHSEHDEWTVFEHLQKLNASTVVRPATFRKIIMDSTYDLKLRVFLAKSETFKLGSKEKINEMLHQLQEGEAKGNPHHPLYRALSARTLSMFSQEELDTWEQFAADNAPKPDYGEG